MENKPNKSRKVGSRDKWAALFRDELTRRETKFPQGSLTFNEVRAMRKSKELPSGGAATQRWITLETRAGRIKSVGGVQNKNGRLVRAVRYICV